MAVSPETSKTKCNRKDMISTPFILLISLFFIPSYAEANADIQSVLSSIQMLLRYYQDDYKNLNLDGFFGLRVLEGQLQLLTSEHSLGRHRHLSNETLIQIDALKELSKNLTALGLEVVKRDDAQYFKRFNPIISKPWKIIKPHRKLNPSLRWEIPQYKAKMHFMRKNFTEATSDKCMSEVMSSDNQSCIFSDACVKLMTSRGFTGYPITHQLLWSMLVENKPQCKLAAEHHLQKLGFKSIDDLQLELCTNNFYEMVAVVEVLMHGNIHGHQQDLFLEQQFVCPSIGFYEFLKKDYMNQIMSWQFPSGCFGEKEDGSEENEKAQIDLTSLLQEYNGERLKFVPRVTINSAQAQAHSRGKISQKYAKDMKQVKSSLNTRGKSEKQTKVSLVKAQGKKQSYIIARDNKPQKEAVDKISVSEQNLHKSVNNVPDAKLKDRLIFRSDKAYHDPSIHQIMPEKSSIIGRRLLVEKKMSGGCLSHKTGVAAGALVMYLRYLIDPGHIKWEGQHDLLLTDTRSLLQVKGSQFFPSENRDQEETDTHDADEEEDEGVVYEDKLRDMGMLDERRPIAPGAEERENNEGEGPDEFGDIKEDDEDDDEMEEDDDEEIGKEMENIIQGNKDTNNKPEYDTDGNPVAPKGRLLEDNENVEFQEESYLQKHIDIHGKRHRGFPNKEDEDADKSPYDMEQEMKEVKPASKEEPQEEEEGHFYDDDDIVEEKKGRKSKPNQPVPTPRPPIQTQEQRNELSPAASEALYLGGRDSPLPEQPNYTALMAVSIAPLFILLFFLFKFVRKRRVHIRYHF